MDFHSLARRELQALCKKNKIPANTTNVSMADALQALKIVEGIEELMKTCQSGSIESSIESLEMPEVTSPFLPPTAARSTRSSKVPKEAPKSVNPMTRAPRTTRKPQCEDSYVAETPTFAAQTNQRKGKMASACRKIDSQFTDCVRDGKKDMLVTPTSTRWMKTAEESKAKSTYSTRRSMRLLEKNNVMLNEVENVEAQFSKEQVVAEEMEGKESVEDLVELSEITAIEDKSEDKGQSEVISHQKEKASICNEEYDDVIGEEQEISGGNEDVAYTNIENDYGYGENTFLPLNAHDEGLQQIDDDCISETEIVVQKHTEELKIEEHEASEDETTDLFENVKLESGEDKGCLAATQDASFSRTENIVEKTTTHELEAKESEAFEDEVAVGLLENEDSSVVDENPSNHWGFKEGGDEELTPHQVTKEANLEFPDHLDAAAQLEVVEHNEMDLIIAEESEEVNTEVDSYGIDRCGVSPYLNEAMDQNEVEVAVVEESEKVVNSKVDFDDIDHFGVSPQLNEGILPQEEIVKLADPVPSNEADADFCKHVLKCDCEGYGPQPKEIEIDSFVDFSEQMTSVVKHFDIQQACLTPSKRSSATKPAKKAESRASISDNKENFGIGSKLVIMKDSKMRKEEVDDAQGLKDLSLRKLTKMVKEKLEKTTKVGKNENDGEAMTRPVLRAISENQVDENQNSLSLAPSH